jgi:5-methylcytosine-specific restriction enzyme A
MGGVVQDTALAVGDRSRAQLKAEPWCRFHAKRGERVSASIADHVERHGGDAFRFWHGALQSLCRHCHDSTKQSLERGDRAPCGLDGLPMGPGHPWGGG